MASLCRPSEPIRRVFVVAVSETRPMVPYSQPRLHRRCNVRLALCCSYADSHASPRVFLRAPSRLYGRSGHEHSRPLLRRGMRECRGRVHLSYYVHRSAPKTALLRRTYWHLLTSCLHRILFVRRIVQVWYTRIGDAEGMCGSYCSPPSAFCLPPSAFRLPLPHLLICLHLM